MSHPPKLLTGTAPGIASGARARRWLAGLGVLGALSASAPLMAQTEARAALVEQGNYWQSLGRADLAEESWRKLLRVDPTSADALYGMAQVELSRGRAEPARSWTDQLRAAHPNDPRATRLQQQARQPGPPASDLQRARAAGQAGRSAEAVALYRSIFDNRPPPEALALEFFQVLSGTPQGYDEARRGIEQLVKDHPDNNDYKLALAQLLTYREPSRREGIRQLAELAKQPALATRARAPWRQALIWLDARAPDAPLYQAYLSGGQTDPAVSARLDSLTSERAASTASPGAQALGDAYRALDRGDQSTAEQRFQQTLRTQPGEPEALGGLGLIRLRQERFAQAQELLEQAAKGPGGQKWNSALRSATYWNLIGQARTARERNDDRTARGLLERAVRLDAREPVGQNTLAELQLSAGDFAEAERGFRRALEAKPSDAQAMRGLVTALTRLGRAADAQALMQRMTPEQAGQVGGLRDLQVDQARAQARAQLEGGNAAGAQRTLEDAMLVAPDSPWIRLDLANIYRRGGMSAQARGVMDGLLMSHPDMPDALYASALLASDAGDPAAGLQYLDRIPANGRTRDMTQLQRRLWAQSQGQRAQALARQGQAGQARALLAQTEATLGTDMPAELWGQLASAYADIGDAPRALAMSRQLLARSGQGGIGDRLLYASILLKTQQDIELAAVLRQLQGATMTAAQRGDFDSLRIAYTLRQTDALREAGNLEAAYAAMAPLVAERPDDAKVLAALARLYAAARDERQALALYQRILQREPGELDTLLAAAGSASALREHGEAENYVAAALKQAPDQARVLAAAGRVYRNAGDNARAEQYLRAAVAADSRVASGGGAVAGGSSGFAVPAANPFAGMTGGAPGAAAPFGGAMQRVGLPATAALPTYPASATYPTAPAAVAALPPPAYPAAGAPPGYGGGYPAPVYPNVPVYPGNAAPMALAGGPWTGGAVAAPTSRAAGTRTTTASRNAAAATGARNRSGGKPDNTGFAAAPVGPQGTLPYPVAQAYPPGTTAPGGYLPPPAYGATPVPLPVPGSAPASTASWSNIRPAASAPTDPVLAELQALESERSGSVSAGTVFRSRAGEGGLSKLSDMQIPIEARFPVGNGKLVVKATPTFLDAGSVSPEYGTASRFGAGPAAALGVLQGTSPALESQTASGVGLSVGYESKNLNASIGTTPLGFAETNVIGNVTYEGQLSDNVTLKGDLSRRPVTDSLVSFAGAKDARTGERFGGVVASGGRLDLTRDDGTYGLYGYGSYHTLTGRNVESNNRAELGGGAYVHLLRGSGSTLTAGMNIDLLHYDKNLSYFTLGHGGYFSPQRYMSVAFPVDWSGRDDRLSWRVNAALGVQSFKQNDAPYFPGDSARQGAASRAAATATTLGLNNLPYNGQYTGTSKTGLAYNLAGLVEYQLAPQVFVGSALSLSNAQNYRQITAAIYLRYLFNGARQFATPSSGFMMRPLSSPYTPLL